MDFHNYSTQLALSDALMNSFIQMGRLVLQLTQQYYGQVIVSAIDVPGYMATISNKHFSDSFSRVDLVPASSNYSI
jgi:hypothetical protein